MMGKGAVILVIGFGLIYGIVGYRLTRLQNRAITNMSYYHDVTNSHTLASAGANTAISLLYQNPNKRGDVTAQSFSGGSYKGGSFATRVDSISSTRLRLRSTATYRGFKDTVEVFFNTKKNNSFSMYAWMSNFEGNVFWITGDTVWGRVHSNGNLHVNGRPVFMEKVTTSKAFSPKPGIGTNNAIFKKGYETGVAQIQFPNDLSDLSAASIAGGRNYTTNVWVTLSPGTSANNDGKAYIRTSVSGPIIDSISLSDPSFNGALWSTQRVYVKGTIDGKLTIGAADDVVVLDDVLYESSPLTGTSDDMLGLVAEDDVIVADNAANNSNCEIDASVFCRTGSFYAENYNTRPVSGKLKLIGGIIQDTRGAVGTFAGSSLQSGFSKRYYFDPRLSDPAVRPPFFPGYYTQTLTVANWWENVRIPSY